MKKLDIGLSASVMKLNYSAYCDKSAIVNVIKQHRYILSPKIMEYYVESVAIEEKRDMQDYLARIANIDSLSVNPKIKGKTFQDGYLELINKTCNTSGRIYVSEFEELKDVGFNYKKLNIISPNEIIKNEKKYLKSELCLFTIPLTNYTINKGESTRRIGNWFESVFKDAVNIIIQDQYILKKDKLNNIWDKYISNFGPKVNSVCIYSSLTDSETCEETVERFFSAKKIGYELKVFDGPKSHSRSIFVDGLLITIDAGLDFIGKDDIAKNDCRISASFIGEAPTLNGGDCILKT